MKISPVGAELFRADTPTDVTNLVVAFRNFANVQIMANIADRGPLDLSRSRAASTQFSASQYFYNFNL